MLLRFVISNYLSFDSPTEFNTFPFAEAANKFPHHIYDTGKVKVLKSTVIYGSNSAGKSNLIDALESFQLWIKNGCINTPVNRLRFMIRDEYNQQASKFLIEFFTAGIHYIYGISIENEMVIEEYLYESGIDKKPKLIFKHHENTFRLYTQMEFPPIKAAYEWITSQLVIVRPNTSLINTLHELCTNPAFFSFANNLVTLLDVKIDYITLERTERTKFLANYDPKNKHPNLLTEPGLVFISDKGRYFTTKENDEIILNKINAVNRNGTFDMTKVSKGTKNLFDLIPIYWSMIHHPKTLVIDEIEPSIHPVLIKSFVKLMMHDKDTRGQLIFTTHSSSLLTNDIFRNDAVWLVENNEETFSTNLYSLHDFNIPANFDIHNGYLIGRFGAIPFTAPLELFKH